MQVTQKSDGTGLTRSTGEVVQREGLEVDSEDGSGEMDTRGNEGACVGERGKPDA
jgi:hypothetical protein